jgi:hypothetical protein
VRTGDILTVANEVRGNWVLLVQPYKKEYETAPKYGDENDSEDGILDVHVRRILEVRPRCSSWAR